MGLNFEKAKLFFAWWVATTTVATLSGCILVVCGLNSDIAGIIVIGSFIAYPIIRMIYGSFATLFNAQTKGGNE